MHKRALAVLGVVAFGAIALPFGLPKSVAAAGPTYSSISVMPFPIATAGTLVANTHVNICIQPRDSGGHPVGVGATVYLSFFSGLFTAPPVTTSTAFVGATALTTTPTAFLTVASCTATGGNVSADSILVAYTTPNPTMPPHGRDVVIAADSVADSGSSGVCSNSAGPLCNNATYVYSPVTQYAFVPTPIAPDGTLAAGQVVNFTVTAEDSGNNPVPGAFLDLSFSASSGGTATGFNHFSGFQFTKITNSPQRFGSDNTGTVQVAYKAASPLPSTGIDVIKAQDHIGVVTAQGTTSYTYGTVAPFSQAPYTPVTPFRVCDTRPAGQGISANQCNAVGQGPITQGQARPITVTGGAVPLSATAIVVNVTAIAPTKSTFLNVYPTGTPSSTSIVNPATGSVVASLVEVGIGTAGQIDVFNALGTINVALDVEGYVSPSSTGLFHPLAAPTRICDTRLVGNGIPGNQCNGGGAHPLGPGAVQAVNVSIAGSGLPTSGVTAVVFNLTAVAPSVSTVLTAYPGSTARPNASNVNAASRQVVPNRVIVQVPAGCTTSCIVNIANGAGSTNVLVDLSGWFDVTPGTQFTSLTPARLCDTRVGTNAQGCQNPGVVPPGGKLTLTVTGIDGLPAIGDPHQPTAIVLNVTAANATASTFIEVYPGPSGATRPNASDLNVSGSGAISNLVVVGVDPTTGTINLFNASGNVNLIVDVYGYYS